MRNASKFHYLTPVLMTITCLLFVGCNKRDARNSGCLAGGYNCGADGNTSLVQNNNSTNTETSANSRTNLLSCSVTATPNQVDVDQAITVSVSTTGSVGSISVRDGLGNLIVGSAASTASFFKTYGATRAGQVIQETLLVQDSNAQYAYCSYQVSVKTVTQTTTPPANQLGCTISVSPSTPQLGQVTEFQVASVNATSNVTFSNFYGSSDWLLSDSYIQTTSATSGKVRLVYQVAGMKNVSVRVSSQGQNAVCSLQITTSGTVVNPAPTALACNMQIAPLGAAMNGTSVPSLAGSLSKVKVTGVGGTAPYLIDSLQAQPEVSIMIYPPPVFPMDSFAALSSDPLVKVVRFRQAGSPVLNAVLKDSTGASVTCSSSYLVRPSNVYAVAQLGGTGSMPRVRTYNGAPGSVIEDFYAYPSSFTGGVAVATGDFDADGLMDYVTIEASLGTDQIRVFKGALGAWYSNKPSPSIPWNGFGALPADGSERRIAAGDFNGDGISDIAISNGCSGTSAVSPRIRVLDGATKALMSDWTPVFPNGTAMKVSALSAGDINGDGHSDLAAIACDGSYVQSISGKSLNTSTPVPAAMSVLNLPLVPAGDLAGLSVGDYNRDGKADLVVTYQDGGAAWVRVYNGTNGAALLNFRALSAFTRFRSASADLDGDGVSEILIAASNPGVRAGTLQIFNGATSMSTQAAQVLYTDTPFYWWNGAFGVGAGTSGN